ncbi:FG-GAP-like repeat-containing protein [Embleya sp. MST-111070]|uniref:FG-GAP-like repeat-containing protein n=1 Tax=Embleya sp. MST-111070 TaxID=3398231 RepID=UPI003F73D516
MGHPPPRPRPYARRLSALVGSLVTLSMTCAVGAVGAAPRSAPTTVSGAPTAGSIVGATADALSADAKTAAEDQARARAVRTGVPVPVPELTTETDTVTANPDGTLGLKRTVEPSRTKKTGVWRELDPTLARAADGTLRPASTTGDLTLGGGGSTLLASMTNDGRRLAFTWPTALPTPVLTGNGALYPGVLPDVDLKVVAGEQGGFAHTLIVKTPAAAKNPQLATLRLGMTTDGVTVTEASDGSLAAKSPDGKVAFTAPAPRMWDSRTTPRQTPAASAKTASAPAGADASPAIPADELASTDRRPGAHATTAPLETAVASTSLTLTPDATLLRAPDTVFPLYIDPDWVPMLDRASMYNWVQQAYPDTSGRKNLDWMPGAGYQRYTAPTGLERSFYRVDYNWKGRLDGKLIKRVTFNTTQVYSALNSCLPTDAQPVYLHLTADTLDENTTWRTQPHDQGLWATTSVPGTNKPTCGNRLVDFDITANLAGHQNWEYLTLGVYGKETPENTSNNGFKRFSRDAADNFIYIEYNTPPNTPTNTRMTPVPVNGAASGNAGYIGAVNPAVGGVSLYATVSDPDAAQSVRAQFHLREVGNGDPLVYDSGWISRGANGHEARADLPAGILVDGKSYRWSVRADDEDVPGNWAPDTTFTVDATPPTTPTTTSVDYPTGGGGRTAGDKGTFTFTATDNASGVDTVEYALNAVIPVGGAARATRDDITNTWRTEPLPVINWGTNALYAQTVDKAGNRSQPTIYKFYAPSNPNAKTTLGDITGDGRIDLLTVDDTGALRMYAADTDPAAGGTIASRTFQGPAGTEDQPTWTGSLITHRGGAGITYDDLYAHAGGQLYRYATAGAGAHGEYFTSGVRDGVTRPDTCVDATRPNGTCTTYTPDWTRVKQILAPGNVDNDLSPTRAARLDLLTLEDNGNGTRSLWLFHGDTSAGEFDKAIPLGTADWTNLDLIAPGDASGDGFPDLWARNRVTGQLYQYASRKNTDGSVDMTALGNTAARTLIGTGFDAAAYPKLTSDGDLDGDGKADLWGQAADGRLYVSLGITPGADGNAFGPMRLIADNQTPWTTCEKFASAQDANVKIDLCGPILAKYKATGGPTGPLRLPTGGVQSDGGIGKFADFQGILNGGATDAHINWSPTTGAWFQRGGTRARWLQSGALNGPLGYPVSDEDVVRDGAGTDIGRITRYAGTPDTGAGAVTWSPDTGARVITGQTYNRWQATGGPRGTLGFPATDEANTPTRPGTYTHFRTPGASVDNGSVYTSPTGGAQAVYGNIRTRWAELGWEQGYLGFPTSDEYDVAGGRRSDFQGGYVRWNGITGATVDHLPGDSTRDRRNEYAGDFDGDHRADVLTVYDYGQSTTAFFLSSGNADGTFTAPRQVWASLAGHWDTTRVKYTVGDFDGDGRTDIAALHVWNDGSTSLFKFISHPGGIFSDPTPGYVTPAGQWDWNRAMVMAGDYNGDGKDDVAMVYAQVADPANGTTTVHTWVVRSDGAFGTPLPGWQSAPGAWNANSAKYAVGDYNGDGRTDIAALYGWSDGSVTLHTLLAQTDGTLAAPVQSWRAAPGTWDWNKTQLTTGDFDGNHRVEIGAMYDLGAGTAEFRVFPTTTGGLFTDPAVAWHSAPGTWDTASAYPVTGDVNGDGRTDVAAMYEWNDGSTTLNTLSAKADGTLNPPTQTWRAAPGTW